MRKSYLNIIYCLPVFIHLLFSSCSVQKRHYLKGWYVSATNKKHTLVKTEKENQTAHTNNLFLIKNNTLLIKKSEKKNEDNEHYQVSGLKHKLFIPHKNVKEINDTLKKKKKAKKIFNFGSNRDEAKDPAEEDHDFRFPLLPLLLFVLGIVLVSVSFLALTLILKDLFMIAILYGVGFLIVSLFLSVEFKKRIIKYQLPHKLWSYNLIIGFSGTIAVILILSVLILIGTLLFL